MNRTASVIIVECLPLFSEALARLLEELGARVVGRTATFVAGLRYLKTVTPDLFILDRDATKEVDVTEMIRAVSAYSPTTQIVLLYGESGGLEVRRARRAGACSCLLKTDNVATVQRAFRRVLKKLAVRSAKGGERTAELRPLSGARSDGKPSLARLTERELEVLPYVARGLSIEQTAVTLCIRPKTVDVHRARLMAKLGIHDRATLTRLAIRESLIPVWED